MKTKECEQYIPNISSLTSFQQVLVVQILRPDRLHSIIHQCVLHLTGRSFIYFCTLQY